MGRRNQCTRDFRFFLTEILVLASDDETKKFHNQDLREKFKSLDNDFSKFFNFLYGLLEKLDGEPYRIDFDFMKI